MSEHEQSQEKSMRFDNPSDEPRWILVCDPPSGVRHVHISDTPEPIHGEEPHKLPPKDMRLYTEDLIVEVDV